MVEGALAGHDNANELDEDDGSAKSRVPEFVALRQFSPFQESNEAGIALCDSP